MISWWCSFSALVNVISSLSHAVSPFFDLSTCHLFAVSSMPLSDRISHSFFYLLSPFFFFSSIIFSYSHPSCSFFSLSLCTARPPASSAHVDMSTVAFDVDPLDLDAEEPPEFQGDPRSSKGMSGSVTSAQANTHRLPFFKKVTLGAPNATLTSPASLLQIQSPHLLSASH